jgi:hypothetical protein
VLNGLARAGVLVCIAAVEAACGLPLVSPPTTAPGNSPTTTWSPAAATPSGGSAACNAIPSEFTTPLLDVRTDGKELVWSRGGGDPDPASAPDLWRYHPGDERPLELFHNPVRDSTLALVAVRDGHYAFVETNRRTLGDNTYLVWAIVNDTPILVDTIQSSPDEIPLPIPFLAMTDRQLLWTTAHRTPAGLAYQLLSYDLAAATTTVLQSADAATTAFWFPSVDAEGDRVVYSTLERTSSGDRFHVYLAGLEAGARPVQLDLTGDATMAVLSGNTVYWKHVRGNLLNSSSLVSQSLLNPQPSPERLTVLGDGLNYPSVGSHYLTAWQDNDIDVGVYDIRAGARIAIDPVFGDAAEGRERAGIGGNLLFYLRADLSEDGRPLELCWQWLEP